MKLILFDVDGTLIDSQNIIVASINKAFESIGLPNPPRQEALSIVGLSLPFAMEALVGRDGPIDELVSGYKNAFASFRMSGKIESPFFEGAQELVETLAASEEVMLGLATGKSRRGVNHILEKYNWAHHFVTIQTADDAASKPHPEMIFRAITETGVSGQDLVMIGDTTYDMAMARAADVRSLGVSWGYHTSDALRETGAELIADSYQELSLFLRRFIQDGVFVL